MDASTLATKMLDWEAKKRELDAIEAEIKAAVMEIGKTQTVGNVRATFANGRRSFDYETAGRTAQQEIIADCSKTSVDWGKFVELAGIADELRNEFLVEYDQSQNTSTDWKAVCEKAHIEPLVASQSEPSVTVKLLA